MPIPTKKLKNGFEIPLFGIGTAFMEGVQGLNNDDQKDKVAIEAAIDLGITHIDTAESYADGRAETLIAKAIKNSDRKKLFLVSKVEKKHLNYRDIKIALASSLERLGTDYLDLYLMHRCPDQDKFKESVRAMNELVDEGLVRHIGLSNTNVEHTKMLRDLSKHPIVVNQVHYNLQFREPEKNGLLDYCQKNDMLLVAWRPLGRGALNKSGIDITKSGIPILDEMCRKYKKNPAQIAINWLISQKSVATIAKSSDIEHLKNNLGAVGWQMNENDIESLRNNFPNQKFISDTAPME